MLSSWFPPQVPPAGSASPVRAGSRAQAPHSRGCGYQCSLLRPHRGHLQGNVAGKGLRSCGIAKYSDLCKFSLEWPPVFGFVSSCGGDKVNSAQISEGLGSTHSHPRCALVASGEQKGGQRESPVFRQARMGVLTDPGSSPASEGFPKAQRWLEAFVVFQAFS